MMTIRLNCFLVLVDTRGQHSATEVGCAHEKLGTADTSDLMVGSSRSPERNGSHFLSSWQMERPPNIHLGL